MRGARDTDDAKVAERLLHLADTEGFSTIAEVWSAAPADSLAGCLWRLYLLRSWVHADPIRVGSRVRRRPHPRAGRPGRRGSCRPARTGRAAGTMIDEVLRGIAVGDFADVLFRAAAFARVVATGRAILPDPTDVEVRRILVLAEQLEAAGHEELAHGLS